MRKLHDMARSFTELKMMTFTRIMSTQGDMEDLVKQLVADEL